MKNLKQKALRGVVWTAIEKWGSQACSLVVFLVLARLLTPDTFGLVALANVFLGFMQIFLEQGFAQALIQRENLTEKHLNAAFWSQIACGILLAIISFVSVGFVADFFKQPKLIPILQCLSLVFIINSFSHVQKAILNRKFDFKIMAMRSLWAMVISGLVGTTMAFVGYGVWSLVAQQLTYELVGVLVLWQAVTWRPKLEFSQQHFQDLYSFGIHVLAFKFIKFFDRRADNLLIGYFLGEVALGYYAISYRVLQVMTQLVASTTNQVALPAFSRLQSEPERFRQAFYRANQFVGLIVFPTFLGAAALTPELVVSLFGEQWTPAIRAMQILTIEGIVQSLTLFHKSVFMSLGKPSWKVKLSLVSATANVLACATAVRWGITAVAIAYVVSSYLVFPISQWAVNRLLKISFWSYLKQFITPTLGSLVMVGGIFVTKYFLLDVVTPKILLTIGTIVGGTIYTLSIALLDFDLFKRVFKLIRTTIFTKNKVTQST